MSKPNQSAVLELRVALTTEDYDRLTRFYSDGLGLEPAQLWTGDEDRALILELGRATLEIFDRPHAELVDRIEAGAPTGERIRFAIRVPDLEAALERLLAYGATLVHPPVITPWRHRNVRLQDPDGLQVTLFQVLDQG
ncbi:VOC family protein [Kallotenue papyrolyticum]|uniref:VOC family protein n=1 Tax=Kallotenue papyrolyticum TaxID=1325125 RepID=UPI00049279F1|nr:VOC family protein [Kallotenue papyrolyticum]